MLQLGAHHKNQGLTANRNAHHRIESANRDEPSSGAIPRESNVSIYEIRYTVRLVY